MDAAASEPVADQRKVRLAAKDVARPRGGATEVDTASSSDVGGRRSIRALRLAVSEGRGAIVVTQLRDYRIREGRLDQFIEEWRTHLVPLRREYGFAIAGAWRVINESRFVWLLAYPGDRDAFDSADQRYYADPKRINLRPDPARLIEEPIQSDLSEVELPDE
jgi:hypothetical protein